ncbi:hypothetical protein DPMN_018312 [Dreissena polymorpha]|uniref:Uncharacterized protein n=1 Tax=Dreissena polymorpha TaxID=45954 RepID=A0A9D4NIH5_DREPO|nr:hypothetical protein DPMN_018312 [Dreissena polymorpha]
MCSQAVEDAKTNAQLNGRYTVRGPTLSCFHHILRHFNKHSDNDAYIDLSCILKKIKKDTLYRIGIMPYVASIPQVFSVVLTSLHNLASIPQVFSIVLTSLHNLVRSYSVASIPQVFSVVLKGLRKPAYLKCSA